MERGEVVFMTYDVQVQWRRDGKWGCELDARWVEPHVLLL